MNSAFVVAFAAVLAVANAGFLGAPAVTYAAYGGQLSSQAGFGNSYSSGIVRGAPLVAVAPAVHHSLVRVARSPAPGLIGAAPVAYTAAGPVTYAAAPVAYAPSALISRSYHGNTSPVVYAGVPHIRVARSPGFLAGAAPVAYAAAPVAYAHPLAYSAPVVKAAPVAYAAHPFAYSAGPIAYAG